MGPFTLAIDAKKSSLAVSGNPISSIADLRLMWMCFSGCVIWGKI